MASPEGGARDRALLALVLALIDIRWGKIWREVPQKGIEVMFVLDVSRSMLAEDAKPSRLERAKQQIGDMLEAMAGDRVGLVVFAGERVQLVPLTSHYQDFRQTLRDVGPENVDRGGSRLGDALQLAASGFLDQTGDHKAVVVLTDGEDQETHRSRSRNNCIATRASVSSPSAWATWTREHGFRHGSPAASRRICSIVGNKSGRR